MPLKAVLACGLVCRKESLNQIAGSLRDGALDRALDGMAKPSASTLWTIS